VTLGDNSALITYWNTVKIMTALATTAFLKRRYDAHDGCISFSAKKSSKIKHHMQFFSSKNFILFLQVSVFNTLIAGAITLGSPHSFWTDFAYSHSIGLPIWMLMSPVRRWIFTDQSNSFRYLFWWTPLSIGVGYFAGNLVGDMITGYSFFEFWRFRPTVALGFLVLTLGATVVATYYLVSQEQLARKQLQYEELKRHAGESQLRLLQSQLEPHMLFNTLANLRALIGTDPQRATQMLDRLNDFLRSTLSASRATLHPLSAEFDRLKDYLELMQIRMGPRLAYTLSLPPELATQPVPPLLLQPLVENAIKHGLEPLVQGGEVTVIASAVGGVLTLEVCDTGGGLHHAMPHIAHATITTRDAAPTPNAETAKGFGLAQVRERLHSMYGDAGALELIAAHAHKTRAVITFPLKNDA
jgi:sensor histidine kinase YesM